MGMTGSWNIDISRHARERIPAQEYWAASYYEVWVKGLERLMLEAGLAKPEEIASGHAVEPAKPVKRVAKRDMIAAILAKGGPVERPQTRAARFAIGKRVRTINNHPSGHTRLPRYARGREGEIIAVNGCHVFPDSNAHGKGEDPQWLYTVRFTARELWGQDNGNAVMLDLWEPYLEPA
jgi:nitrile hydratase